MRVADGEGALLGELEEVTLGAGDTVGTPLLDVDPVGELELDGDAAALLDVDPVGEFELDGDAAALLDVDPVGEFDLDTVGVMLLEVDPVGELELEGEAAALLDVELEALPPTQRPKPATRAMERTTRASEQAWVHFAKTVVTDLLGPNQQLFPVYKKLREFMAKFRANCQTMKQPRDF